MDAVTWINTALRALPVDEGAPDARRAVAGAAFARSRPSPVHEPVLAALSPSALALLLPPDAPAAAAEPHDPHALCGNSLAEGMEPAAHCYCGFQFGHFSGQLGDGAAQYLGEASTGYELQLKGCGPTPFSRTADGRKVVRSSVREFLCSEAMHALGVPTTRAGSVVVTSTRVARDPDYSGTVLRERVGVVSRLSRSFLRFGSLELARAEDPLTGRAGPSVGDTALVQRVWDYAAQRLYPGSADPLADVAAGTGRLVADWQALGFCHGVLNTDNMSLAAETIDYGPFGFMEWFDPDFVCNSSDQEARYTYRNQPAMCRWNVERLAESLGQAPEAALAAYDAALHARYLERMRGKLGLPASGEGDGDGDEGDVLYRDLAGVPVRTPDGELVAQLLCVLDATRSDWTNAFRELAAEAPSVAALVDCCAPVEARIELVRPAVPFHVVQMLQAMPPEQLAAVRATPELVEEQAALWRERERLSKLSDEELRAQAEQQWTALLPRLLERRTRAPEAPPVLIPRNHVLQAAIDAAETAEPGAVQPFLELLTAPFAPPADVPEAFLRPPLKRASVS